MGGANSATISNVLNVIAEPENRKKVLQQAYDATKPDGVVYISIYEGSKDGKPKESTKGWQENRNTQSYLSEVKEVFSSASVKNGIIRASKN